MLETSNLVRKYAHIRFKINFADVNIFLQKISIFGKGSTLKLSLPPTHPD